MSIPNEFALFVRLTSHRQQFGKRTLIQESIASFVEAARKGQVMRIDTDTTSHPVRIDIDFAIPSFDFGHISDPMHPDCWIGSLSDSLEAQCRAEPERVRLPFPECIFLFHFLDNHTHYEAVNLIHTLQKTNGVIESQSYFWSPPDPITGNRWSEMPIVAFTLGNRSGCLPHNRRFSPSSEAHYRRAALIGEGNVSRGAMLLHRNIERSPVESRALNLVNLNRVNADRVAVPHTIRIRVRDQREILQAKSRVNVGPGAVKVGHERRGHWRTLRRSGQQVWVTNSSINGGSPIPPNYHVA